MSDEHRTSDMVVAFGAGALLGAAAALLLAPKSGADTRRDLSDMADKAIDQSKSLAEQAKTKTQEATTAAGEFVRDQKERVGQAIQVGKEAYLHETVKG